jgi:hypothetical protein
MKMKLRKIMSILSIFFIYKLRSQKKENINNLKITFNSLKEYEKQVLENLNNDQIFEEIPDTNQILGNFLDRVLRRSMYVYKNR